MVRPAPKSLTTLVVLVTHTSNVRGEESQRVRKLCRPALTPCEYPGIASKYLSSASLSGFLSARTYTPSLSLHPASQHSYNIQDTNTHRSNTPANSTAKALKTEDTRLAIILNPTVTSRPSPQIQTSCSSDLTHGAPRVIRYHGADQGAF